MRYRRLMPRIWHDEKFTQLDALDQHITMYLLTSPESNRIGLYRLSLEKGAVDTKITDGTFPKRFANVCQTFGWRFDNVSKTLFIPSWIRYNEPENRNVMAGNLRDLEDVPNNPFMFEFAELIQRHKKAPKTLPERLANVTPTVAVTVAVTETVNNTPLPPEGDGRVETEEPASSEVTKSKRKPTKARKSRFGLLAESDPNFERFYELFPRKVAKLKAQEKWNEAISAGIPPETILQGLERNLSALKEAHTKDPYGSFCPHPTTWLGGGQWNDVPKNIANENDGDPANIPGTPQYMMKRGIPLGL